mgnify:CR=1 FL=1
MSLKSNISFLGLNYKKEILKIIVINLILSSFIILIILFKLPLNLIIALLIFIAFIDYFLISRYADFKKALIKKRDDEFIDMLSFFQIYVSNNIGIYKTFEMIIPFTSEWVQDNIRNFLSKVDQDKSVKPYIEFAEQFNNIIFESVMISIYQMVDEGNTSLRANQFNSLFTQLSNSHQIELVESKRSNMDILNSFPLIGAGYITLLLTFSIISIIGDFINVI